MDPTGMIAQTAAYSPTFDLERPFRDFDDRVSEFIKSNAARWIDFSAEEQFVINRLPLRSRSSLRIKLGQEHQHGKAAAASKPALTADQHRRIGAERSHLCDTVDDAVMGTTDPQCGVDRGMMNWAHLVAKLACETIHATGHALSDRGTPAERLFQQLAVTRTERPKDDVVALRASARIRSIIQTLWGESSARNPLRKGIEGALVVAIRCRIQSERQALQQQASTEESPELFYERHAAGMAEAEEARMLRLFFASSAPQSGSSSPVPPPRHEHAVGENDHVASHGSWSAELAGSAGAKADATEEALVDAFGDLRLDAEDADALLAGWGFASSESSDSDSDSSSDTDSPSTLAEQLGLDLTGL